MSTKIRNWLALEKELLEFWNYVLDGNQVNKMVKNKNIIHWIYFFDLNKIILNVFI
jgi:hypothetical protein